MSLSLLSRTKQRVLVPKQINLGTRAADGEVHVFAGHCMGTSWSVRVVGNQQESLAALERWIVALLERIENQMSHFRAHSDLRRFADLPAGEWMELPAEFARVLRGALEVAEASGGAFDPALAGKVDAWGFGAGKRFFDAGFVPPRMESVAGSAAGWQSLEIDAQNRIRQPGGVALNLAAIAKGFAVDAVSELLSQAQWKNHLVEIGGELRGTGVKPDGQPWWVALESPGENCPLPATRIALHGLSVATSGDYRRCYRVGEQFIHHTIDPETGMPAANRLSSVTVIHRECMYADAWATALMVLGPNAGLALAEKMQLCVLLQGHDAAGQWIEAFSAAWQRLLQ